MTKVSELDEVVRLTTRRTWALLLALLLVLGAGTTWAVLATVESTVTLDGILVAGEGPSLVTAPADGTLRFALGQVGQPVRAGDALFVVETADGPVTVPSPVTGVVSTNRVTVGAAVAGGALLGVVDRVGAPLRAVLLLDVHRGTTVAAGTPVRGGGWTGTVASVEAYPVTVDELASRYGRTALSGRGGQDLVRPVLVDLGVPAWAGATLTPVQFVLVLGSKHPADLLLHGGS